MVMSTLTTSEERVLITVLSAAHLKDHFEVGFLPLHLKGHFVMTFLPLPIIGRYPNP
jgi:hypothetical protein